MTHPAMVKYGLLAVLVAGGAAGGFYLSGNRSAQEPPQPPASSAPTAAEWPQSHRFPLTALDAKDTVEAPDLATGADGSIFLTWGSKTGAAERTVFFTRSLDGGRSFDDPKAISKAGVYKTPTKGNNKAGGHERRSSPHLAAFGSGVHLSWGEARADGSGMRFVLATSADAGATFGAPRPVHSGDRANPTFTALATGPDGALACSWLDSRSGSQQPFAAVLRAGADTFGPERAVHPAPPESGVCPCCPTGACFGPDGTLFVAFRNVKNGCRDIAIGRLKPGQSAFEGPFFVIPDTWKFDGCPHDGPALTLLGDTLHIVWMDARSGPQRCYYARANTSDMKFDARELHPGVPGTQGNAKLFADASGALHAVWEESLGAEPTSDGSHTHSPPKTSAGSGRAVMHAVMPKGQGAFGAARAVAPQAGAFQTRPVIAGTASGSLFVAWNELDTTGKAVVVTRLAGASEGARP
ncbi:MAG TPA: sialidase family protein [Gemmata sp.]